MACQDADLALALELQAQWEAEDAANASVAHNEVSDLLPVALRSPLTVKGSMSFGGSGQTPASSLVAPEWEDLDPTPDLHALFQQYDRQFFQGRLVACEVKWSPRMTRCAGVCSYQYRSGFCSIRLSVPLLKLRPRSDLVETLLHEMIHAYLFVTDGNDDHDGHGPAFHEHMYRINRIAKTNISVYHSFHDEVAAYQTHWWQCDGPCRSRKPFFGLVKRSMNRPPGKYDRWWAEHQATCGGTFVKIKEPEDYGKKKKAKTNLDPKVRDIRGFLNNDHKGNKENKTRGSKDNIISTNHGSQKSRSEASEGGDGAAHGGGSGGGTRGNIFGFGGTSFNSPSTRVKKSGTIVVGPGKQGPVDNSNSGQRNSDQRGQQAPSSTGPGHRLGSISNATTSLSNSTDASLSVREHWSKLFDKGPSNKGQSNRDLNNTGAASNNQIAKRVKNRTAEGGQASLDQSSSQGGSKRKAQSDTTVPCPVCATSVAAITVNQHLDECLTRSALKKEEEEEVDSQGFKSKACPKCKRHVYLDVMSFHLSVCDGKSK